MDKATYQVFRRKAMRYASLKGYGYLAEDFAQEYILHVIETRSQFIETFFIDFLRSYFKASRNPENRNKIFYNYEDFESSCEDVRLPSDVFNSYVERCEEYNSPPEEKPKIAVPICSFTKQILDAFARGMSRKKVLKKFKIKQSLANQIYVFHLLSKDYTQREIGKVMGLTESRISQIFKKFKKSQSC